MQHEWKENGIIVATFESFPEKVCVLCGAINWGGDESGECLGSREAANAAYLASPKTVPLDYDREKSDASCEWEAKK